MEPFNGHVRLSIRISFSSKSNPASYVLSPGPFRSSRVPGHLSSAVGGYFPTNKHINRISAQCSHPKPSTSSHYCQLAPTFGSNEGGEGQTWVGKARHNKRECTWKAGWVGCKKPYYLSSTNIVFDFLSRLQLQEAALLALSALAKDTPSVAAILAKSNPMRDRQVHLPLSSVISLCKSRYPDPDVFRSFRSNTVYTFIANNMYRYK